MIIGSSILNNVMADVISWYTIPVIIVVSLLTSMKVI
jgi:hypothetical protein